MITIWVPKRLVEIDLYNVAAQSPAALAEKADRLGLPLLQLPTDMRFAELADAVSREIARRRIPAEQERQLAVLLHHLISGAPLSEAMERQAVSIWNVRIS
jgi:hypothetical protein